MVLSPIGNVVMSVQPIGMLVLEVVFLVANWDVISETQVSTSGDSSVAAEDQVQWRERGGEHQLGGGPRGEEARRTAGAEIPASVHAWRVPSCCINRPFSTAADSDAVAGALLFRFFTSCHLNHNLTKPHPRIKFRRN